MFGHIFTKPIVFIVGGYALICLCQQTVAFWAHFLEDYWGYFIQASTIKSSCLTVSTRIGYKIIALTVKSIYRHGKLKVWLYRPIYHIFWIYRLTGGAYKFHIHIYYL